MFSHVKELIVVMTLACTVFVLARPLCLRFMTADDFAVRRNVWLGLTVCAFLSPSFWIYAGFAFVGILWAARRDSNPIVLYVLLFAIVPNFTWYIPFIGINQLFDLGQGRLLAIVLLVPLAVALGRRSHGQVTGRAWIDACLIGYLLLQLALPAPYETVTNTARRAVLLVLDYFVVYWAFSRALDRREKIVETMATYVLMAAVYAAIGIFESFRGWLLYEQIALEWGHPPYIGMYLLRAGSLRAYASFGHSLTYGYAMAMALAFWLHLRTRVASPRARWLTTLLVVAGVYVSHSRGPWLTAVVVYLIYTLLAPGGVTAIAKGLAGAGVLAAGLALTPIGERIASTLPFIGTLEQETVTERQRLAEVSWALIQEHPVFGDPFVLNQMQELAQGQGFVDLMNGYAAIALFSGLAGVALFAGFFFGAIGMAYAARRKIRRVDADLSSIGAALIAAMLGSAIFIATASVDWVEYVLVGMCVAYAALAARETPVSPQPEGALAPGAAGFRKRLPS
jgi:hypothetical protein